MVWGTPNHPKWDLGAKNGKKRFLTRKYKNNKFSRFFSKIRQNSDNSPEGSTEIGTLR